MPVAAIQALPNSGPYHRAPRMNHARAPTRMASQLTSPSTSKLIPPPLGCAFVGSVPRAFAGKKHPRPPVPTGPPVHVPEGTGVDGVHSEPALAADPDQAGLSE